MRFNDAITGAVLVVFAVAEILYTRTFPSLHGQAYGPDLFPMLIGFGLGGCGCVLILRGLLARRSAKHAANLSNSENNTIPEGDNTKVVGWIDYSNISHSPQAIGNALLTLLFLIVYILFSDWVGFIPLSILTISVLLYRLGSSIVVALVIALATTLVIQLLFAKVLLVPLPAGWLQGLVW